MVTGRDRSSASSTCVATGPTREATEQQIRQAIEMHLRGMREDGLPIPEPVSHVEYIDVPA